MDRGMKQDVCQHLAKIVLTLDAFARLVADVKIEAFVIEPLQELFIPLVRGLRVGRRGGVPPGAAALL